MSFSIKSINNLVTSRTAVMAVAAITAILFAVGFALFPPISDDLGYMMPFKDYFLDNNHFSLSRLVDCVIYRYFNDNARLANIAMYILEPLPRPVLAALSGGAVWLTVTLGLKLIKVQHNALVAMIWAAAVTILLPWVDQMYIFDFQLNYLWGGALSLFLANSVLNTHNSTTTLATTALVTGLWQESFGFPLFVTLCTMALIYPNMRNTRTAITITFLLIGLTWLYLSPGGQSYRATTGLKFIGRTNIIYPFAIPSLILAVLFVRSIIKHRKFSTTLTFLTISSICSTTLMMLSMFGPRVGWWSVLAATLGLVKITCTPPHTIKTATKILSPALYLFATIHLCFVNAQCLQERNTYNHIIAQYRLDNNATIFANISQREKAPLILLQKPVCGIFTHYNNVRVISQFHSTTSAPMIKAVPYQLAAYRHSKSTKIPGSANLTTYNGLMVGPWIHPQPVAIDCYIDYGNGPIATQLFAVPFFTPDGKAHAWYSINASYIQTLLNEKPLRINLHSRYL